MCSVHLNFECNEVIISANNSSLMITNLGHSSNQCEALNAVIAKFCNKRLHLHKFYSMFANMAMAILSKDMGPRWVENVCSAMGIQLTDSALASNKRQLFTCMQLGT